MTTKHDEMMFELISAAVDDEATEFELHRLLTALDDNPSLLNHWQSYTSISHAIKNEASLLDKPLLVDGVRKALANEAPLKTSYRPSMNRIVKRISSFALAASVAFAVVIGFNLYEDNSLGDMPNYAAGQLNNDVMPVSTQAASTTAQLEPNFEIIRDERLDAYLKRHAEMNAKHDMLPYVRMVTQEASQ